MGQLIDNLIAFRILYLLVKPFDKSDAFKLGIIDKDGNLLRHADELKTPEEKDAYNYLTRLTFNLKRLIAKVPGGKSMIASIVAAYFLIKEGVEHDDLSNLDERFDTLLNQMNEGVCLVEEQLLVEKFLVLMKDELNEEGAPANSVGSGQVADNPTPLFAGVKKRNNWKDLPKAFGATAFEVSGKAYNGFKNAKVKGAKWDDHMVPSEDDKDTYDKIRKFSKTYSNKPILIKHRDHDAYQYIKH